MHPIAELPPGVPSIPLTPEIQAAYQKVYDECEIAIEGTKDPGLLAILNATQLNADIVLTKNALFVLTADGALFAVIVEQIKSTNEQFAMLKKQIEAIGKNLKMAGDVLGAISKVLQLVPIA